MCMKREKGINHCHQPLHIIYQVWPLVKIVSLRHEAQKLFSENHYSIFDLHYVRLSQRHCEGTEHLFLL